MTSNHRFHIWQSGNSVNGPTRDHALTRGRIAFGSTKVDDEYANMYFFRPKNPKHGKPASSVHSSRLASPYGKLMKVLFKVKEVKFSGSRENSSPAVHDVTREERGNSYVLKESVEFSSPTTGVGEVESLSSVAQLQNELQLLRQRLEKEEDEMQKLRLEVSILRSNDARARNDAVHHELKTTNVQLDDVDLSQSNCPAQHSSIFNWDSKELFHVQENAAFIRMQDQVQNVNTEAFQEPRLTEECVDESDSNVKVTELVKVIDSGKLRLTSIPVYEPDNFFKLGENIETPTPSRSPPDSTDGLDDLPFMISIADIKSVSQESLLTEATKIPAMEKCRELSNSPPNFLNSQKPCAVVQILPWQPEWESRQPRIDSETTRYEETPTEHVVKVAAATRLPTFESDFPDESFCDTVVSNDNFQFSVPASTLDRKHAPKSPHAAGDLDGEEHEKCASQMSHARGVLQTTLKTVDSRKEESTLVNSNGLPRWSSPNSIAACPQPLLSPLSTEVCQQQLLYSRTRTLPWIENDAQLRPFSQDVSDSSKTTPNDNLNEHSILKSPVAASFLDADHTNFSRYSLTLSAEREDLVNHSQVPSMDSPVTSSPFLLPRSRHPEDFALQSERNISEWHYCIENSKWQLDSNSARVPALKVPEEPDVGEGLTQPLRQSRRLHVDIHEPQFISDDEDSNERTLSRETSFSVLAAARQKRRYKDQRSPRATTETWMHHEGQLQVTPENQKNSTDDVDNTDKDFVTITPRRPREMMESVDRKNGANIYKGRMLSPQSRQSRFFFESTSILVSPS